MSCCKLAPLPHCPMLSHAKSPLTPALTGAAGGYLTLTVLADTWDSRGSDVKIT